MSTKEEYWATEERESSPWTTIHRVEDWSKSAVGGVWSFQFPECGAVCLAFRIA